MARMTFKGARIAVRPDTPAVGKNNQSRGGRGILERQEDLYPARARIMLTRSVSEACKPFPRLRFALGMLVVQTRRERRPHPGTKGRSTTRGTMGTAPNWSCNSICNLKQFRAIQRNYTKSPAISRSLTKTTANYRKFQQGRGIAVSAAQAILRTGLTSPNTLLLPACSLHRPLG
jgi:hypothetical protein